jgi:Fis family transcriptional regulator
MTRQLIEDSVRVTLEQYFRDLGDAAPQGVHEMMMGAVEKPLLEVVMRVAEGNQSRAAAWLGINRNTLRRKLLEYSLIE